MLRKFLAYAFLSATLSAQNRFTPGLQPFITIDAPVIALQHVRIVDGTGTEAREDQTLILDHGKITATGPSARSTIPAGAQVLDLKNTTVIPGLVGMHEHLFYPSGSGIPVYNEQAFSFPRLYLASGVTTARTGGSLEPYTDLNLKTMIDAGKLPGPKLWITGPYLEGPGSFAVQMHELKDPEDATRTVDYWAAEGVTSFKAYMNISRAELKAAVEAAHRHGIKVTGHLCSVGFSEAADIGIDNLEHGFLVDTEFHPGKRLDVCPAQSETRAEFDQFDPQSPRIRDLIAYLVKHNVAITSTLAVFEAFDGGRPPLEPRFLDALTPEAQSSYLAARARSKPGSFLPMLKREQELERAFVKAGGLLMSGADPTGNGGALAGFADQRNIELLVEGGFTFPEAIKIATANGAQFLGESERIGTIAPGKQADLVVIEGNPGTNGGNIEKVKLVFKDGAAYDPTKLLESVRGAVPLH